MGENIADICRKADLPEWLGLGEEDFFLDSYILAIGNLVVGKRNLQDDKAPTSLEDEQIPLAKQAVDYAVKLVDTYGDVHGLFTTSLDAIVPLSAEERLDYLQRFYGLVEMESSSPNSNHIFNGFIQDILVQRLEHYNKEFEAIGGKADDPDSMEYNAIVVKLKKDLDLFFRKVEFQLDMNDKWDGRADDLDYEAVYGGGGSDGEFTASDVFAAIVSGDAQGLIEKHGVCAVKHRASAGNEIMTVYFSSGDETKSIAVRHDGRFTGRDLDFYRALGEAVRPPTSELQILNGRALRFIGSYRAHSR